MFSSSGRLVVIIRVDRPAGWRTAKQRVTKKKFINHNYRRRYARRVLCAVLFGILIDIHYRRR